MKQLFQPRNPLVRAFTQTLKRCCPEALNLLNSGAIETEIDLFKKRYQQSLPETFYDFYRWYNGSAYESSENQWLLPFEHGRSILSLALITKEKKKWDSQSQVHFQEWRPGEYWNKAWIPFMKVDDLWLRVVDTQGCFGGIPGQIISFECKGEPFRSIECDSFDKWLETAIAKIELECLFGEFHEIGFEEEKAVFAIEKRINPHRRSVELVPRNR
jgi:cell wall assembly regulator SMI1